MEKIIFVTDQKIRLDEFLRIQLPQKLSLNQGDSSNSKIRRLIVSGSVFVNSTCVTRPAFELRGHSTVTVNFDKEKFFYEKQPDDIDFELTDKDVLFEDENLIFINKPSHFPVEQTITGNRNNLHDVVVQYLWKRNPELRNPPYVGIMHRLDRDTSGVILFTKNRQINKDVSDLFQKHDFTKKYLAITKLNPEYKVGDSFTVEMMMDRISSKSSQGKWGKVNGPGGQFSKTDFKILKQVRVNQTPGFLVECFLYTGRTHQIRVHLSSKGLAILGDTLYGAPPASRIYLHASELSASTQNLSFSVKSTPDFIE